MIIALTAAFIPLPYGFYLVHRCLSTVFYATPLQTSYSLYGNGESNVLVSRILFRNYSVTKVTANTLCRLPQDQTDRYLAADFNIENPVVLQLGGSDVHQMYSASKIATQYGYSEINLNVGCPSEKVAGKGCFGAALMLDPQLVSDLCRSISEATGQPATVKCRIGVNDNDSYQYLSDFIDFVQNKAGVEHFIIHARKAILDKNFSPDDNRKIPPLKYDYVYQLVREFPELNFTINGGILNFEDIQTHLQHGEMEYFAYCMTIMSYPSSS